MNADTPSPMIPPGVAPVPTRHRRRVVLWWVLGAVGVTVVALPIAAASIEVPYYAIAPGSARATDSLVLVEDADTYPAEGDVLFTTVSVERMTLLQRLRQQWFPDAAVDVVAEEHYLAGRTADENEQFNQQLMDQSKDAAAFVALRHLGYDVALSGRGAQIASVAGGSPADGAIEVGDTVVAAQGSPIMLNSDLVTAIGATAPGTVVDLTVEAVDGSRRDVAVTLEARPDDPDRGFLGVESVTRGLDYELPFPVTIDSGQVGGPSAGLAFTLSLLDLLTPGELTGGEAVAVTGAINADGTVGEIGGIVQKIEAVRDAGVEVFLVPAQEAEEALEHAGDDLRVVGVGTLEEALTALSSLGGNALALPTLGPGAGGA